MFNSQTGKIEADIYDVEIWRGKNILTVISVRTTSEEEAVVQAVKQIKTIVKRIK